MDILSRNNIFIFKYRPVPSKQGTNSGTEKQNTTLITQLFLSLQCRPDADIADFFRFENQRDPPTLSFRGMLRSGQKSDIMTCVGAQKGRSAAAKNASKMVVDGAAMAYMVTPTMSISFRCYVRQHIVPFLQAQATATVTRIDVCWDTYPEHSVKVQAHIRHGSGPWTPYSTWPRWFLTRP